jgi:hypothetical protein
MASVTMVNGTKNRYGAGENLMSRDIHRRFTGERHRFLTEVTKQGRSRGTARFATIVSATNRTSTVSCAIRNGGSRLRRRESLERRLFHEELRHARAAIAAVRTTDEMIPTTCDGMR